VTTFYTYLQVTLTEVVSANGAHDWHAAAIDLRMRQLADEGVPRSAIIDRMTAYVVDLGKIWNATTDEQLAALMEEAAEAERRKLARPYDDLPELPDAVKARLASLLGTAAQLQRDYQSVRDAGGTSAPVSWPPPLSRLHAQWDADRTDLVAALQGASVPRKAQDIILPALARIARQIDQLNAACRRREAR
jgi:hypothetical protein